MVDEHTRKYPITLNIREPQIRITVSCHLTSTSVAAITKTDNNKR